MLIGLLFLSHSRRCKLTLKVRSTFKSCPVGIIHPLAKKERPEASPGCCWRRADIVLVGMQVAAGHVQGQRQIA